MTSSITALSPTEFPRSLLEIPKPPEKLFIRGELPPREHICIAVVGSRRYTDYGRQVVEHLLSGLHGYPISIISGLALGIDALAHQTALKAGLHTLAVPGSGLHDDVLYPRTNQSLAKQILAAGGGLLSEYEPDFKATKWSFPKRNRIMVGLSRAVLLIEATERSGTLITARLCADYNRELLVVPGTIFSPSLAGNHQFLKLGATPITESKDILDALNIEPTVSTPASSIDERFMPIVSHLNEPQIRDTLIRTLGQPAHVINGLLMEMELLGIIDIHGEVITLRKAII